MLQTTVGRAEDGFQSPLQLRQRTAAAILQNLFPKQGFLLEKTDVKFDVHMLQRTEALIKSQTETMKPIIRHQGCLFLALLTVAPRHGLQMAQEKAEYTQQS